MSLLVLKEGEIDSPSNWKARLGIDADTWDELIEGGVFARSRVSGPRITRLAFVGFIGLADRLLTCVPRFGLSTPDPISWLRRVLASYFASEDRRSRPDAVQLLSYRDDLVFREYDALGTLLAIHAEAGLYKRAASNSRKEGGGFIDWARTLAVCDPVVSNGTILYSEPYHRVREAVSNEVSMLQAAATIYLSAKYGLPLDPMLSDALGGAEPATILAPERLEANLGALRRERAVTYLARDLRLLDVLEAVLTGMRGVAGPMGARLHGTTAFALVWEDALRDLFGDDSQGVNLGRPVWYDYADSEWSNGDPAIGPEIDILLRGENELLLLDAKYHFPFPRSRPGWADIVKQLYYAETIERLPTETVRNAFVLPMPGEPLRFAGRVAVEGGNRSFPPIEVWQADPNWVFSTYGHGDLGRHGNVRARLLAARNEMPEMLADADSEIGA